MPCTHIYVYLRRVRCGCIASPLNSIYLRCAELPAPTRAHLLVADCWHLTEIDKQCLGEFRPTYGTNLREPGPLKAASWNHQDGKPNPCPWCVCLSERTWKACFLWALIPPKPEPDEEGPAGICSVNGGGASLRSEGPAEVMANTLPMEMSASPRRRSLVCILEQKSTSRHCRGYRRSRNLWAQPAE